MVRVGAVPKTAAPEPVSSERRFANFNDVLIDEVARKPSDEVALHTGTPPETVRMLPVEPMVRFASVFAPEA